MKTKVMNDLYKLEYIFMEQFERVCSANDIMERRFIQLIELCLDNVDVQWITPEKRNSVDTKEKFREEFITHFQHPNAKVVWQTQIRNL